MPFALLKEKRPSEIKKNGLPRQSADWLAMPGFFDSLKGRRKAALCLYFYFCLYFHLYPGVEGHVAAMH